MDMSANTDVAYPPELCDNYKMSRSIGRCLWSHVRSWSSRVASISCVFCCNLELLHVLIYVVCWLLPLPLLFVLCLIVCLMSV